MFAGKSKFTSFVVGLSFAALLLVAVSLTGCAAGGSQPSFGAPSSGFSGGGSSFSGGGGSGSR